MPGRPGANATIALVKSTSFYDPNPKNLLKMSNLSEITDPVSDDRADSAEAARDCEESKENTDKKRALDDAPDWNRPEWFVVGKHDLLNPNLQKLGGFPVTRAKLAGVGADVAIVDGIRDFATGEIEMRSVTGKPAAKAEPPNGSKNYFYFPYVDGKQHQHALYGTVYGDFRFRKGDVQYRDEYTAKVRAFHFSGFGQPLSPFSALFGRRFAGFAGFAGLGGFRFSGFSVATSRVA